MDVFEPRGRILAALSNDLFITLLLVLLHVPIAPEGQPRPSRMSALPEALRQMRRRGGSQLPAAGSWRGSSCVRDLLHRVGGWRVLVGRACLLASSRISDEVRLCSTAPARPLSLTGVPVKTAVGPLQHEIKARRHSFFFNFIVENGRYLDILDFNWVCARHLN